MIRSVATLFSPLFHPSLFFRRRWCYVTCSIHSLEDTLKDTLEDASQDTIEDTIEDSFENAFLLGVKISLARQLIAHRSKSQFLAEAKHMLLSRGAQDD